MVVKKYGESIDGVIFRRKAWCPECMRYTTVRSYHPTDRIEKACRHFVESDRNLFYFDVSTRRCKRCEREVPINRIIGVTVEDMDTGYRGSDFMCISCALGIAEKAIK